MTRVQSDREATRGGGNPMAADNSASAHTRDTKPVGMQKPWPCQEDLAGGVAPHPSKRALYVPRHRAAHRPGYDRGGAGLGLTEFSRVWAYTPSTADVAVIVSTALPPTVGHFGLQDGVWVTDRPTVLGVATALRLSLRQVYLSKRREAGKTEKATVLYEYLCSPAFSQRVEAMIEAYDMQFVEIEKEKRFFATKWARQERSVRTMIEQTHGMYGDLQSIIGRALPDMKPLALPEQPLAS